MKTNNKSETIAATRYEKEGWKIADSGWPDFLLYRWSGGQIEVKFAEIKRGDAQLRDNQKSVLTVLSTLAPTVVCWDYFDKATALVEEEIKPPVQDRYYHRTEMTDWAECPNHEKCSVRYHVCEPGRETINGC